MAQKHINPIQSREQVIRSSESNFTELYNMASQGEPNVIEEVQVNGTALPVDSNKAVNIDLTGYSQISSSASSLILSVNTADYKITATLKDASNNTMSTSVIDLPLESVVVSGSYDSATKEVVLTLQNGNTVRFSVADLVSGLQQEITSSNKLDADLVDDTTSTNKFVTASEKAQISTNASDIATLQGTAHTHSNKALLDTYTQTETDLANAVSNTHSHSNKTLLDSYDQTNANIKDAITKKHSHSNKSLLDTYTQTETNLADAVSKKHSHSNKTTLDNLTQSVIDNSHTHSNKSALDNVTQSVIDNSHTHSNKTILDNLSTYLKSMQQNGSELTLTDESGNTKSFVNIILLEDNGSTTDGTWLAKTNEISSLVDGQMFLYRIAVAGASTTTLDITANGTSLGAKTIYRVGTSKLTTHYGVGQFILLTYNTTNTCFRVVNDYDANNYANVRQYQFGDNVAGTSPKYPILTRYNLTNKNGSYDTAYTRFHTGVTIDTTTGNLDAPTMSENGTALSSKYLGISAKASDSDKLNGQDASYYLNYNNLSNQPTIPTALSQLTNDSGYLTSAVTSLGGSTGAITLGSGLSISGNVLSATATGGVTSIGGKTGAITLTSPLSINSSNQMSVDLSTCLKNNAQGTITANAVTPLYLKGNSDVSSIYIGFKNQSGTSIGAFGADANKHPVFYSDAYGEDKLLALAEDIPTATSDLTNDSGFITSHQSIKSLDTTQTTAQSTSSSEAIAGSGTIKLHKVSKTGTYSDLIGKPTIPTKVSDLTNDSGFITGITSNDVTTALGYTPYNSSNPNGYTSNTGTITGVQLNGSTIASSGVANVKALPNFNLNISHQTAGNPRPVKFLTINYATAATYFKMSATSCHDNGTSYQFLEDIIIGCTTSGTVVCNVYKYCQQTVTYDSATRNYGDVFYVIDTTNKIVDFYILCGQYASSQFTPATKIGNTTIAYITQYTGTATYYSSGTKVWANGNSTTYAKLSDVPSTSNFVDLTSAQSISGVKTFTNGISVSGRSAGGGDDEGIVVGRASNNYAGVCLGSPSGMRSVFYLTAANQPVWRWNNGSASYDIVHPAKAGTIALTSDVPDTSSFALASEHPIKLTLVATCNSTNTYGVSLYGKFTAGKWYLIVPIITVNTSDYYMKLGTSNSVKYMGDNPLVCRASDANTLSVAWFNPSTSSTGSASVKYGNYCCIYEISF